MNLTAAFLLCACLTAGANGFSQSVTLKVRQAPLATVFTEVEKQTGYSFLYAEDLPSKARPVSLDIANAPLNEALKSIFAGQPFTYRLISTVIIVNTKDAALNREYAPPPSIDVKGRIVNEKNEPVLASIIVKGTKTGTFSDSDGYFELKNVAESAVLVISGVNIEQPIEVTIDGRSNLGDIHVKSKITSEEDVIVSTGYQAIPKERATGSFSLVDQEMLNLRVSQDILSRLKGMAAGLAFNASNAFGTEEISIRGRSTLLSNANPLIVVDNFPYEGSLDNINPNDIESITILKDAAASSIWGTRAGNGVIVITTKKGRYGRGMKVEFNTNFTTGEKPDLFYLPRMSTIEMVDVEKMLFDNGAYDDDINNTTSYPVLSPAVQILLKRRNSAISSAEADRLLDSLKNIDNRYDQRRYGYQKSFNQQYALTISGGSDNLHYFLSGGYDLSAGILNQKGERISLRSHASFRPINRLELTTDITYTNGRNKAGTLPGSAAQFPYERLEDDNGNPISTSRKYNQAFINNAASRGLLDWSYNPITDARLNNDVTRLHETRIQLAGQFTIIKGIRAEGYYQYQAQTSARRNLQSQESYYTRDYINSFTQFDPVTGEIISRPVPPGGIVDFTNGSTVAHNGRIQFNAERTWNIHQLAAVAGIEARQVSATSNSYRIYGYDDNIRTGKTVDYNSSFGTYPTGSILQIDNPPAINLDKLDRFRSYYMNAAYTLLNRYTLSGSARKDESNYFGAKANHRGIPLWSAGLRWDITREKFYRLSWLPRLTLRTTYGYNGNVNKDLIAFTTIRYLSTNSFNQPYAYIEQPPNPELRWERSGIVNFGLDFGLKNNRLSGSIEYYRKRGMDLIGYMVVEGTTGVTFYQGNVATMQGQGVDVQLNSQILQKSFGWEANLLFSYNKDKVTGYYLQPEVSSLLAGYGVSPFVNYPVFAVFSYKWAGLDPLTGDPQGIVNHQVSKDYSSLVNPDLSELVYHGPARPVFFGSFRNRFSWKGISLTVNFLYKFDYYFRRTSLSYSTLFDGLSGHSDFSKRWQQPGDEQSTYVPSMIYPNPSSGRDEFYQRSEVLVERGDHIRWQDAQLSYRLDRQQFAKLPFRSLQLYFYAGNLGIIWRRNDRKIDPDYQQVFPASRTYSIGLKAGL